MKRRRVKRRRSCRLQGVVMTPGGADMRCRHICEIHSWYSVHLKNTGVSQMIEPPTRRELIRTMESLRRCSRPNLLAVRARPRCRSCAARRICVGVDDAALPHQRVEQLGMCGDPGRNERGEEDNELPAAIRSEHLGQTRRGACVRAIPPCRKRSFRVDECV